MSLHIHYFASLPSATNQVKETPMKIAVSQSNYIPWKGYFDMIAVVDIFILYDEVQYTKNDWRNRNMIMSNQGPQWITIPVKQDKLNQRIDDTTVAQNNWAKKHWKTLQANYGKAPFFTTYAQIFEMTFQRCAPMTKLSDINRAFIEVIMRMLDIDTELKWSTDLNLQGDRNQRLVDAIIKCKGDTYLSGPAAKIYLDEAQFAEKGIAVEWMDYSGYKTYTQIGNDFQHGVSILDLIFNEGPNARDFMNH